MDQGKSFNTLLAAFFATFVIGFGMGFSFHFALSKSPGQHSYAPDVPVATAVAPVAQPEPADEPEPELDPKPEFIEEPVESGIWPGRHLFIAVNGQWLSDASRELLREVKPGGVVLRSSNLGSVRQTLGFVREIKESVTPDDPSFSALPLIAVSHEGGDRNELGLVNAPGASDLGAARDRAGQALFQRPDRLTPSHAGLGTRNCGAVLRCRAGAGGQSCATGRPSSRSTGRPSRRSGRVRKEP